MSSSTKKLENLLDRATNPDFEDIDVTALDGICESIQTESNLSNLASKIMANKIQSNNLKESLNALSILQECMTRCGTEFQQEIGKFRFLNELIKLVSKKYRGNTTPKIIRDKILDLLLIWTVQYPHETKIKEAYNMLRTQGIIHESPQTITVNRQQNQRNTPTTNGTKSQSQEDEKSRHLRKLLQSKNPLDVHAANLLIQNMVREDEKRTQMNSLRLLELQKVRANVTLLNEMLDQYKHGETSDDELHTINELLATCENLHPTVLHLAQETQENEETLDIANISTGYKNRGLFWTLAKQFEDILEASDSLANVFEKYKLIVIDNDVKTTPITQSNIEIKEPTISNVDILSSLLDFNLSTSLATPPPPQSMPSNTTVTDIKSINKIINNNDNLLMENNPNNLIQNNNDNENDLKLLSEIFTNIPTSSSSPCPFGILNEEEILQPQIAPTLLKK